MNQLSTQRENNQEPTSCLICGNVDFEVLFYARERKFRIGGEHCIRYCKTCGLLAVYPQPTLDEMEKYYLPGVSQDLTHEKIIQGRKLSLQEFFKRILKRFTIEEHFGYRKQSFFRVLLSPVLWTLTLPLRERFRRTPPRRTFTVSNNKPRILDIGCGNGTFLHFMHELGWDTYGVETAQNQAQYAIDVLKLKVFCKKIEEVNFENSFFDCITMWGVLEHIRQPDKILNEICRILKPTGKLIIVVPNGNSLAYRIFGNRWYGLDVPRHLFTFNPTNLTQLLLQYGFQVKSIRYEAGTDDWLFGIRYIIEDYMPYSKLGKILLNLFFKLRYYYPFLLYPLFWFFRHTGKSETFEIVAAKL